MNKSATFRENDKLKMMHHFSIVYQYDSNKSLKTFWGTGVNITRPSIFIGNFFTDKTIIFHKFTDNLPIKPINILLNTGTRKCSTKPCTQFWSTQVTQPNASYLVVVFRISFSYIVGHQIEDFLKNFLSILRKNSYLY